MRSDEEIADDIYSHINASNLKTAVTGTIESDGERTVGSTKEDIVINIISNGLAKDVQEATVAVNIYVKDINVNGQWRKNRKRIKALATIAKEVLKLGGLGKDYTFRLESQRVFKVEEIDNPHEHFINNKLSYQLLND